MGQAAMFAHVLHEASQLTLRLGRLIGNEPQPELLQRVAEAARQRVFELEDPLHAYDAAMAIMNAFYADVDPPAEFWATEVGQACAHAVGYHRVRCPFRQAGWILNVSRQRVYQLCDLGRLARMDDGSGVASSSVREELWRHGRRRR